MSELSYAQILAGITEDNIEQEPSMTTEPAKKLQERWRDIKRDYAVGRRHTGDKQLLRDAMAFIASLSPDPAPGVEAVERIKAPLPAGVKDTPEARERGQAWAEGREPVAALSHSEAGDVEAVARALFAESERQADGNYSQQFVDYVFGLSANERCLEDRKLWDTAEDYRSQARSAIAALRPSASKGAGEERETFASINDWCDETFGLATVPQIIARAKEEFAELETEGADHAIEAADVVICLCRIPGFADALQRKMAINRKRKWRLVGNGTGYHIPDAIEQGQHMGGSDG